MSSIKAHVEHSSKVNDTYTAIIKIIYRDKTYHITVSKLVKKPEDVSVKKIKDYILLELKDTEGKGFSTCCIRMEHFEKGCLECPSLIIPPKK
ncbi:MAG: hypothetical protein DRO23_03530 [Thermoprotei archaeon]|nr:MAG: hypothetical protein DRO23_03530 [Thermoprotei archaeon]